MNEADVQVLRRGASSVMVVLPGALMTPLQMVDAGLFEAVRNRGLALDLVAPDLHADIDDDSAALQCLENLWLAPARAEYEKVWLGGISRGGQLALAYQAARVGAVDGLCLISPYAGSRLCTNAIGRVGGLDAWKPSAEQLQDPDFRLWQWLKNPAITIPVFMGYGDEDRFADGMRLLARRVPAAVHCTLPGGHDWSAWLKIWHRFFDQGHFLARP